MTRKDQLLGLIRQLIKYASTAVVGGILDYGILVGLVELFDVHYLLASLISLTCAMVAQYILNVRYVFRTGAEHHAQRFSGYLVLGLIGLGLNQLIIYIAAGRLHLYYVFAKVCASVFVGIYNFASRKLYLENIDRVAGNVRRGGRKGDD